MTKDIQLALRIVLPSIDEDDQKDEDDEVFVGTINQDAALDVRVTKLARDNTLSRVMKLVAEAQSQQSPTQQFVDKCRNKSHGVNTDKTGPVRSGAKLNGTMTY